MCRGDGVVEGDPSRAPERGSVESMIACADALVEVHAAHAGALSTVRAGLGSADERRALGVLRSLTEDLQLGLGVLLEELTHREATLARDPETWAPSPATQGGR